MGSAQQFPSGLNKWIDSDKPVRSDFVRDNEIIDQDAMWKSAYDSGGDVAALGGIPAYVGQQSLITLGDAQTHAESYAQSVNQATAAISGNVLEITSDIARTGSFYDVQFVAPAAHSMAQQIVIDGDAVTLTALDGTALSDGAWQQGSVVTLTKKGDKAFFKTGGVGNGGSLKVIRAASLNDLPAVAAEGTIAYISSVDGPVSFSVGQPSAIDNGHVWIRTGIYTGTNVYLNDKDSANVLEARQYNGISFVPIASRVRSGGSWKILANYLVKDALVDHWYALWQNSGAGSVFKYYGAFILRSTVNLTGTQRLELHDVNLTGVSRLIMDAETTVSAGTVERRLFIGNTSSGAYPGVAGISCAVSTRQETILNVSNYNGSYYVMVENYVGAWVNQRVTTLYNIRME